MRGARGEVGRKAFHLLVLVYWAALARLGWPRAGRFMACWVAVAFAVETARLRIPAVGRRLSAAFSGVMRDSERSRYSGLTHAAAGSLAAMLVAGGNVVVAGAAIGQLAFGDAAAALVGKAFGTARLPGGKSIEGSLACLAAGVAAALLAGARPGAAVASAAAASIVELAPPSALVDDNFWMPVVSAVVLRLAGAG